MATSFAQVDLIHNTDTVDWEFMAKTSCKRRTHATNTRSAQSPNEFENANNNTKLSMIFEEILNLKVDQAGTCELISVSSQYMKLACGTINGISTLTNQHSSLIKTLSYTSIDREARSRRNNLNFRGLHESRYETCSELVFEFLATTLQIDTSCIIITRAHRLSPVKIGHYRPIIVNLMNYNDVEHIMANAKKQSWVLYRP